jgi:hypothetical protein
MRFFEMIWKILDDQKFKVLSRVFEKIAAGFDEEKL